MTTETKTPETDAAVKYCKGIHASAVAPYLAAFARTLEHRNAELAKEIADLKQAWEEIFESRPINGMSYREAAKAIVARNTALAKRVGELEDQVETLKSADAFSRKELARGNEIIDSLRAERDGLTAQLAAAQADSRRVDVLEKAFMQSRWALVVDLDGRDIFHDGDGFEVKKGTISIASGVNFRAAIDAAMSTPPEA